MRVEVTIGKMTDENHYNVSDCSEEAKRASTSEIDVSTSVAAIDPSDAPSSTPVSPLVKSRWKKAVNSIVMPKGRLYRSGSEIALEDTISAAEAFHASIQESTSSTTRKNTGTGKSRIVGWHKPDDCEVGQITHVTNFSNK